MKIQKVGDSLTVGLQYHPLSFAAGLVPYTASWVGQGYGGYQVNAFGPPRDFSSQGPQFHPTKGAFAVYQEEMPDLVHILGGTNDIASGVSPATVMDRLNALLMGFSQIPRTDGKAVMFALIPPPPMGANVSFKSSGMTADKCNAAITDLTSRMQGFCQSKGIAFIPNGIISSDLSADGIHLTSVGYDKLATAIGKGLSSYLAVNSVSVTPPTPVVNPANVFSSIPVPHPPPPPSPVPSLQAGVAKKSSASGLVLGVAALGAAVLLLGRRGS